MKSNKPKIVRNICVITLTNIGDAILTFPVIDALLNTYPEAALSVMAAPKSSILFEGNQNIHKVYIYNKRNSLRKKIVQFMELRKEKFDMIVDLKNSALSHFVGAKKTTAPELQRDARVHMYKKHMNRLKGVVPVELQLEPKHFFQLPAKEEEDVSELLSSAGLSSESFVVIAPGSLNEYKCWAKENYTKLAKFIASQYGLPIVLIGDANDSRIAEMIKAESEEAVYNLCGQTTLIQCAEIIKRAMLVVANDSGPMHMACYLDRPIVAIFGPSNEQQYGPWNKQGVYVKGDKPFHNKDLKKDQSTYTDINSVSVRDVINKFKITGDKVILNYE